jgi:hypothetical protein
LKKFILSQKHTNEAKNWICGRKRLKLHKNIFSKFRQRVVAKFRMKQRNFAKLTPLKFMSRSQKQAQWFCLCLQMLQTTTRSLLWWDMKKLDVMLCSILKHFWEVHPYGACLPKACLDERYHTRTHPTIFVIIFHVSIYNICNSFFIDTVVVATWNLCENTKRYIRAHEKNWLCTLAQNHCVCFREQPINFWCVNIVNFRCFLRNFALARCPKFEKIVFV